jgi:serine/threonine protein phosphatase PrpC
MSVTLVLTGYDLSDEGPCRTLNEDATLVREDLGLFAVADGAGGRGVGDVAANLALRSIENYIGATVRRSRERPDFDLLGIPEQARRLSSAIHQAHQNVMQIASEDKGRKGMASTVVALLLAPRTRQVHLAHVGNSRCYRLRHGRLERLTNDHTIATEILERRPDTPEKVLENLQRNSVVSALGMNQELRVSLRSLDLLPGDRFLLCTDGLTDAVETTTIWFTVRELDAPSVIASELLGHALAAHAADNISILVADCRERAVDDDTDTLPYNEIPEIPGANAAKNPATARENAASKPSELDQEEEPSELEEVFGEMTDGEDVVVEGPPREAIERWSRDSEPSTLLSDSENPGQKKTPDRDGRIQNSRSDADALVSEPGSPPSSTPFTLTELDLELDEFPLSEPPVDNPGKESDPKEK